MKGDELDIFLEKCLELIAPHASYDDDDNAAYERLSRVRSERLVREEQLLRHSEVIRAMQYRFGHRHPIRELFWRKPWRSTAGTGWKEGATLRVKFHNLLGWLRFAHDCQDPSVGCSCHPSYRFPAPTSKETSS